MFIDPRAEAALDAAAEVVDDVVVSAEDRSEPVAQVAAVMAPDESTSWADGTTHEALLVIAEGITQLAGFDVAAVSVVRDSQHMQVMAVAGNDEARDILLGTFTPITRLMEELEHAEDWGMFQFVPHESLDPESESWGWVPDLEPVSGPDAWHPMDLLVAPLYGPNGELRGTLSIDCPTDGRRPDEAHRRILNRYAEQAARALYIAVEREAFAEQVRVLSATRDVVRNAARERNIGMMLDKIQPSLIAGFRSLGSWIHTFDEDGHGLGAIYTGDGARVQMPPELVAIAERAAADSWRAQRVGLVSRHLPYDPLVSNVSGPEFQEILRFLEGIGVGSLLFVPVGAGRECLGSLVLTRALGDAEWTPAEVDAALEVGRDLGRAVLNARALDRERELVRELKALDDYKTKLIATLSHELKSPLAAMLANIEYLQETVELDSGALAVLAAVDRGAVRLVRVVEDLLLLAKVGDPHLPLLTRPVNLPDVVDDVVNARLDRRPAPGQGVPRGRARPVHRGRRPGRAGHHGHQPAQQRDQVLRRRLHGHAHPVARRRVDRAQLPGPRHRHRARRPGSAVPRVLPLGAARGQGPARHRARPDHRRPDRDPAPGPDRGRLGAGQGQHVPGVPACAA